MKVDTGSALRIMTNPILLFVALEVFSIILFFREKTFFGRCGFGLLTMISIPPLVLVLCWIRRIRELYLSFVLIFFVFLVQFYISYRIYPQIENHGSSLDFLTPYLISLFSVLYGLICINSCLIGLSIGKKNSTELEFLRSGLVFVSIAIAFYVFIFQIILREKNIQAQSGAQFDASPFILAFILMAVAISFLYVSLGHGSAKKSHQAGPLPFMISASLSFSVGFAFSVFVLETDKTLAWFHDHWFFLCIWTIFASSVCMVITRQGMDLMNSVECIVNRLLGEDLFMRK